MRLHVEGLRVAHVKYTWRAAAGEAERHVARQTNEGLPGHFDGSAIFRDVAEFSADPYVGFVALVTMHRKRIVRWQPNQQFDRAGGETPGQDCDFGARLYAPSLQGRPMDLS